MMGETIMTKQSSGGNDYSHKFKLITNYLEENYTDNISLEELANRFHISKFHFHKLFKAYFKCTPKDYLERLKLERAAHLMVYTNTSVTDIAFEMGYQNHETFTRAFKAKFQVTPLKFRKSKKAIHYYSKVKDDSLIPLNNPIGLNEKPKIKIIDEINVVYQRYEGDYRKIDKVWKEMIKKAKNQNLLNKNCKLMGIYFDDPDITSIDKLRYDACIQLDKKIQNNDIFRTKVIESGKFMVFQFFGFLNELDRLYEVIYSKYILSENIQLENRPSIEVYVTSPAFQKSKKYHVEILIPIK